eukprot:TRINITY_DN288_c0_g1_i2.p1 TRINITY_DN288_c0_g1~~TRINITY_DN288_c0_g1_i2.p1  ORF type:complete len:409 (+),score=108.52 TRINITY_DN288_c0_g1_i2:58-1284(+)
MSLVCFESNDAAAAAATAPAACCGSNDGPMSNALVPHAVGGSDLQVTSGYAAEAANDEFSAAAIASYRALGLPVGACVDRVRLRFQRLAVELHPDKHPTEEGKVTAKQRFQSAHDAFQTLLREAPAIRADASGRTLLVYAVCKDTDASPVPCELSYDANVRDLCTVLGKWVGVSPQRIQLFVWEDRIDSDSGATLADLGVAMETVVHYRVGSAVHRYEWDDDEIDCVVAMLETSAALGDRGASAQLRYAIEAQMRRDERAEEALADTADTAARIGVSLSRNGHHAKAELFFRRAYELSRTPLEQAEHLTSAAMCLAYQGLYEQTVAAATAALTVVPSYGPALLRRGWANEALEEFQLAEQDFEEAQRYFTFPATADPAKAMDAAAGKHRSRGYMSGDSSPRASPSRQM